ncbi:peptide-methionine (R)-S-oxide reductase [Marinicauda salina]|uniref:peptide-methionine (R)-S-oxide reductase n=1 Tax=Marinicauda salina TaxID=2135793 RepID=A0A2U2BUL1_9PROT|nr:peptide-methionine (R)-S-oxide reductase MsrB [Marinicauda salina]PWE17670.1 peptide-methionine (R)-S-oxide reductase [Marinicauda salina]
MIDRRLFTVSALALFACGRPPGAQSQENAAGEADARIVDWGESDTDWTSLTENDWRARLTDEEFRVLRQEGTERAGSSPLNDEHRAGTYVCAGCALPLFRSETKFESGTGWPSFYEPIEGALDTKRDYRLWTPRTEYHCARCSGHQGHVFDDGPPPTGQRWCNNGVALDFVPDAAA